MKWTIAFLILLGLIAALSVVLLVNAFRADSALADSKTGVPVVVAAADLPAWTVLTAEDVEVSNIQKSDVPRDTFTNTALVVGKVLSVDVVAGQILTDSRILATGGPADIAALLVPGMRAVSVTLSSDQISGGLLYPRCFVDVLASFKLSGSRRDSESKGEALATTLLERIKVLAIAGESMLNTSDEKGEKAPRRTSNRLTVTLELDAKQAEALQLAVDNGSISLALRNPLDNEPVSPEATVLDRGKLSRLGSLLGAKVAPSVPAELRETSDSAGSDDGFPAGESSAMDNSAEQRPAPSSHWGVTVIRGSQVVEEEVKAE